MIRPVMPAKGFVVGRGTGGNACVHGLGLFKNIKNYFSLRAQRSNLVAIVALRTMPRDCFVATLLAMTVLFNKIVLSLRAQRSNLVAIAALRTMPGDCVVATLLAMTKILASLPTLTKQSGRYCCTSHHAPRLLRRYAARNDKHIAVIANANEAIWSLLLHFTPCSEIASSLRSSQ